MDPLQAIVTSQDTVSAKIRALDAAGIPRAEIARLLGKRYQHVRNVLEGDKLRGGSSPASGVAETSRPLEGAYAPRDVEDRGGGAYRLVVRPDGSVMLPEAVRAAFAVTDGGAVMARLEGDEFKLISTATAWRRIDELMAPYRQPGVSWVDELIAERRREAAREDGDA